MMKKIVLSLVLAVFALAGYSQDIKGKWLTEAGDAQVEIYEANGKVNGKIVWLKQGPETKDTHNPDEKLRSRKLMGVNILSGLSKKKEKWEGGRIYNPKNGRFKVYPPRLLMPPSDASQGTEGSWCIAGWRD